mgnify:CR=1 FL=1
MRCALTVTLALVAGDLVAVRDRFITKSGAISASPSLGNDNTLVA